MIVTCLLVFAVFAMLGAAVLLGDTIARHMRRMGRADPRPATWIGRGAMTDRRQIAATLWAAVTWAAAVAVILLAAGGLA